MAATPVPERLTWAVHLLDVQPDDEILEIGCGPGVAVSLVCDRLVGGHLTAVDRSATAIARATARNAAHVAVGRVTFRQAELAGLGVDRPVDKVFAVDVNVFWTRPAGPELGIIRGLLRPGGVLHLVYGAAPEPGKAGRVADILAGALAREGFPPEVTTGPSSMICVSGRRADLRAGGPTGG